MKTVHNQSHFEQLRSEYPFFEYQNYRFLEEENAYRLQFNFNLGNKFTFQPETVIPKKSFFKTSVNQDLLHWMAFHIGMVELISYWKLACPPLVIIKPFQLNPEQKSWWKKLYFNGLGEFFYVNDISTTIENFMEIRCDSSKIGLAAEVKPQPLTIVPVGGGKDSVVTLELLKKSHKTIVPLIVNPRKASSDTASVTGFSPETTIVINRSIDPLMLQLNSAGFLNGHTPFSALLAFHSAFAALITGAGNIALSNESSASESTVHGENINHQYSKSFEFESDFRFYLNRFIVKGVNYFSFLRPLSELQIAFQFSKLPEYHAVFRSCNAGSKTDSWCGKCPKCLFTFLILSPFLKEKELIAIFGKNLLEDTQLSYTLEELRGKTAAKPFECVGTVEEVELAVRSVVQRYHGVSKPLLVKPIAEISDDQIHTDLEIALRHFDPQHFLDESFIKILKDAIGN